MNSTAASVFEWGTLDVEMCLRPTLCRGLSVFQFRKLSEDGNVTSDSGISKISGLSKRRNGHGRADSGRSGQAVLWLSVRAFWLESNHAAATGMLTE